MIEFNKGEFITDIKFGSDIYGIYALKLFTNSRRIFEIGNMTLPLKKLTLDINQGVVGLFGAYRDSIFHIGFYLDDIKEVNFTRNRDLLLIRYKGDSTNEYVDLLRKLDDYLFRYLAKFI